MTVDVRDLTIAEARARFCRSASEVFGPAEVEGLPPAVRRYLEAAIAVGTPLVGGVFLTMHGHIKVGRWLPFRAEEVLAPHEGFLWAARAAGVIVGSDRYIDREGVMDWRALGLIPVSRAVGPDVSMSAVGRGAGEAVWVPTTLLPRFGVTWTEQDATHIAARFAVDGVPAELRLTLDDAGLPIGVDVDRWGDPDATGTCGWWTFGGDFTVCGTFGGLTVPTAGRLGWHHGTDRWSAGEFFRVTIDDLSVSVVGAGS